MKNNSVLDLPLEGKIRSHAVRRITGIAARSTIWRLEQAGKFPKSTRITPRLTVWDAAEVRAWLTDPVGWAKAAASQQGTVAETVQAAQTASAEGAS